MTRLGSRCTSFFGLLLFLIAVTIAVTVLVLILLFRLLPFQRLGVVVSTFVPVAVAVTVAVTILVLLRLGIVAVVPPRGLGLFVPVAVPVPVSVVSPLLPRNTGLPPCFSRRIVISVISVARCPGTVVAACPNVARIRRRRTAAGRA